MKKQEREKPYESVDDWLNDIRYLKWPLIIIIVLIFTLLLLFQLDVL